MQLEENKFTHAIARGEKQIGLWISLCNNYAAEVIASAGYDWVLLDMEHSPNDYFSVLGQLQAFASSETTAMVRVEWNDAVAVKRLLDLGAPGLLFPMIQSVEEAMQAVAATRYRPRVSEESPDQPGRQSLVASLTMCHASSRRQRFCCSLKRELLSNRQKRLQR